MSVEVMIKNKSIKMKINKSFFQFSRKNIEKYQIFIIKCDISFRSSWQTNFSCFWQIRDLINSFTDITRVETQQISSCSAWTFCYNQCMLMNMCLNLIVIWDFFFVMRLTVWWLSHRMKNFSSELKFSCLNSLIQMYSSLIMKNKIMSFVSIVNVIIICCFSDF